MVAALFALRLVPRRLSAAVLLLLDDLPDNKIILVRTGVPIIQPGNMVALTHDDMQQDIKLEGFGLADFGANLNADQLRIAKASIRAYHECARYMTKKDQQTAATELKKWAFKGVTQPTQHKVVRRTDEKNKVDLWFMDCIYPGMVDSAKEKFTEYIGDLKEELRFL
ncbi:unnamed protein product [Clonostachys rhizophaga]|uniref:Uncharacterized protein n=1 Tax=Clonostachys rhizophaga TaxID=160324 RepID=A0A9N9YE89_9HYPO|nr:unnamed protein product [Clonostachys rhizophaga]